MSVDMRTVLIVEDSDISREMLEAVLEDDYRIRSCGTLAAAREILAAEWDHVSVVLLDLRLPDGYGLDLLKHMQDDPSLAGIPVIVLTADERAEVMCLEKGAVDFIPKPYPSAEVILARIRRTIELADNSMLGVAKGKVLEVLSSDTLCVYYMELQTGHFVEYSATEEYHAMGFATTGDDFFAYVRSGFLRAMPAEDGERFLAMFSERHVIDELKTHGTYTLTFRLGLPHGTKYVSMQIGYAAEHDDRHVVVGVSNIDDHVKARQAFERVRDESMTFSRIAFTLAQEYSSIHYVNILDDTFIEYSSDAMYGGFDIEKSGSDFFMTCRRNTYDLLAPEDRDIFQEAFTKQNIMRSINETGSFNILYRLVPEDEPVWMSLKAVRVVEDPNRIVVAATNVDLQIRQQERYRRLEEERTTFTRIARALADDYFSIYVVDPKTSEFVEYRTMDTQDGLGVVRSGPDFFAQIGHDVYEHVHADDCEMFLAEFQRDKLLSELRQNGTYTIKYRSITDGTMAWVNLKATLTQDSQGRHIIIGVNNIDAEVRREQEYNHRLSVAREKAYRDPLTGTKSKLAFLDRLDEMNGAIAHGEQGPFSVIMCDVNGLKQVNDVQGHAAGDHLIREAAAKICRTFTHSPVYRVGGDEFAAISEGEDYEHIEELVAEFRAQSEHNLASGGLVIACGLAIFGDEGDFDAVFRKADANMYENKKHLKP